MSQLTTSQGLCWLAIFLAQYAILGLLFAPIKIAAMQGKLSFRTVFGLGIFLFTLSYIPTRIAESYYVYHATWREGWYPVAWAIGSAAMFTTVISWAVDRHERVKDEKKCQFKRDSDS